MVGPYTCYACGKRTKGTREFMLTVCLADDDGRRVPVGPDCHRKARDAGVSGYQPPKGGPRLYFDENMRRDAAQHYPEERGPSNDRRLTCVCGNPDPGHML